MCRTLILFVGMTCLIVCSTVSKNEFSQQAACHLCWKRHSISKRYQKTAEQRPIITMLKWFNFQFYCLIWVSSLLLFVSTQRVGKRAKSRKRRRRSRKVREEQRGNDKCRVMMKKMMKVNICDVNSGLFRNKFIPKHKLRFPGRQISWVSEWLSEYAIFVHGLARQ